MTANVKPHAKTDHVQHPARGGSPLRLVILLGVLAIVGGGLFYDYFVAAPGVKAANEKLHATVLQHNEIGLRPGAKAPAKEGAGSAASEEAGGMLYSQDIQKILGMSPSWTKKEEFYTVECYRWWGWVPLDKHYITVLYIGDPSNRHYSTHYVNEMPEDFVLPNNNKDVVPVDLSAESASLDVAAPGARPPGPPRTSCGWCSQRQKGRQGPTASEGGRRPEGRGGQG